MLKEEKILSSSELNKGKNFPPIKTLSFTNILESKKN
jgi:hypothetical protein